MKHLSLTRSLALRRSARKSVLRDCGLGIDSLNWLSGAARRPLSGRASVARQNRFYLIHHEVLEDVETAAVSWFGEGSQIS